MKSLDERAEHDSLRETCNTGADGEGAIPERDVLGVPEAKFKGHPAEDKREQHNEDREIDRRQDDSEGKRKRGKQTHAAEDEPGLVAIPHRRNRVHHQVAPSLVAHKAIENAYAKIETVECYIEEDGGADDERPDGNEVYHSAGSGGATTGPLGRPLSISCAGWSEKPPRTTRIIMYAPDGNMTR